MNQATMRADVLGTGLAQKSSAQSGRSKLAMVIAAALAGAVLALAANAAIGAYQAGVSADQAARANVLQLDSQRRELIRSERAEAPAAISNPDAITDADRSVVQQLANERAEFSTWSVPQQGVPAFMQSERDEAPTWSVPQEGVPSFMKTERDEAPASH